MSPSKENIKIRAQRPGSRLQELEQELAKIHHRGSVFTGASTQPLTPPIPVINPIQMQQQNLLTSAPPISTVPVATVTPNIVTPRSGTNTPIQAELQDNIGEVSSILCNIFAMISPVYIYIYIQFLFLFRKYFK